MARVALFSSPGQSSCAGRQFLRVRKPQARRQRAIQRSGLMHIATATIAATTVMKITTMTSLTVILAGRASSVQRPRKTDSCRAPDHGSETTGERIAVTDFPRPHELGRAMDCWSVPYREQANGKSSTGVNTGSICARKGPTGKSSARLHATSTAGRRCQ